MRRGEKVPYLGLTVLFAVPVTAIVMAIGALTDHDRLFLGGILGFAVVGGFLAVTMCIATVVTERAAIAARNRALAEVPRQRMVRAGLSRDQARPRDGWLCSAPTELAFWPSDAGPPLRIARTSIQSQALAVPVSKQGQTLRITYRSLAGELETCEWQGHGLGVIADAGALTTELPRATATFKP